MDKICNIQEAHSYLDQFTNYERTIPSSENLGLSRMEQLLARLGSPHHQWRSIHVAGTKGKGSVCALTANILKSAGARVGLYTSPHLIDLRERIQVDGHWISENDFVQAVGAVRAAVSGLTEKPTYFEALTAAAFWWFAQQKINVAVIEVGLGGRLDATNVLVPDVAAITQVSFDHTQILGNTLSQIAHEKAGILKKGKPVVVAPQPIEARQEIEQVAAVVQSPLIHAEDQMQWRVLSQSSEAQQIELKMSGRILSVHLPLLGNHQAVNLATAVAILHLFSKASGVSIPTSAIEQGAESVVWPGRFQLVGRKPWIIVDGAHNVASAHALALTTRLIFPSARIHIVLGIAADKDISGVSSVLRSLGEQVIATTAPTPRALSAAELGSHLKERFPHVEIEPDPLKAVERAKQSAGPEDVVLVTGSLYLAGIYLREGVACHE